MCSVTINREIIVSLFGNHPEEMIKSEDTLTVILIYPHSLFSYFTILSMTAVTFLLCPPRLAFTICGRRWQNDVYEIKYSVCGFHINISGVLLFSGSLSFVYVRDVAWLAGHACRTFCTVNSTNNCRSNYTFLLTGEKKK